MKIRSAIRNIYLLSCILTAQVVYAQTNLHTDVLIVGGGTGGTAAGIQSARTGAKTIVAESTEWLGGMISAAGVSATDGNHRLNSGIWQEFREQLYKVYGGPKAVETGWVSNTLFEPHVADSIFKQMAKHPNLQVLFNHKFKSLKKNGNKIVSVTFYNDATKQDVIVHAKIFIDGTELGDVIKAAGVPYDLGMEAGKITGETVGVERSNNIVQDLTYVAVLKDYGSGADKKIARPFNYDPAEFDAACTDYYRDKNRKAPNVDAKKMLDYGKLPRGKYMLNWPGYGNDTYLNIVELNEKERSKELEKAKQTTLRFIYFIQDQLGYKHLGLADDEFPTTDKLALIPYHRESRRVKGLVRFTMRNISEPFTYGDALYRTGISVGDYPIDHHHKKNPAAPQQLEFYPIPSFNVPLGALIPRQCENLIAAEKSISVSNVVNGTTRLQPCVLLTGQAAGVLAALSIHLKTIPGKISVRSVQKELLHAKAYLMPYIDVNPSDAYFSAVQKIGAVGLLRGTGVPYKWANQTWFRPNANVNSDSLRRNLQQMFPAKYVFGSEYVTVQEAINAAETFLRAKEKSQRTQAKSISATEWSNMGLVNFDPQRLITRAELAVLFDTIANPFDIPVNHQGSFMHNTKTKPH